jgi:hypothetical protein
VGPLRVPREWALAGVGRARPSDVVDGRRCWLPVPLMYTRFQIRLDGYPVETHDTAIDAEAAARDLKAAVGEQLAMIRDAASEATRIVEAS